jgi:TolA-binding protein
VQSPGSPGTVESAIVQWKKRGIDKGRSVHYLRGNLHLARGQLQEAKAAYTASLNRLLEVSPTQPKVPAIYYKLGTVALRLRNYTEAL